MNRAFEALTAGKAFTQQQQRWLDRIRLHLVQNLTIERDDFEYLPVFADFGGWGKANKDFDGKLVPLVTEINADGGSSMSDPNALEPALMTLFRRTHVVAGLLNLLSKQLGDIQKQITRSVQSKTHDLPAMFMGMSLPIIDLTGKTDDGWLLHYASGGFSVADEEYGNALEAVTRRNSAWSASQVYEAFETFLKDILMLFFLNSPAHAPADALAKFKARYQPAGADMTVEEWRHFVQYAARGLKGKDNHGLFLLARGAAPNLEAAETGNQLGVNLIDWYAGASKARHAVTHGDFEIKPDEWNELNQTQMLLCQTWFPCRMDGHPISAGLAGAVETNATARAATMMGTDSTTDQLYKCAPTTARSRQAASRREQQRQVKIGLSTYLFVVREDELRRGFHSRGSLDIITSTALEVVFRTNVERTHRR